MKNRSQAASLRDRRRIRGAAGLALAAALFARPVAAAPDAPCESPRVGGVSRESGGEPAADLFQLETAPSVEKVRTGGKKRFLAAAGEVVLLEVGPWAYDRYVSRYPYAFISWETIKSNFKEGFHYDRDNFSVNQSSHPYHGSLFFDSARSNGYGFWESGLFALSGSLLWECCMENTAPSVNDLVNTTLGGMTRGEVSHRLSAMILDNTSSGRARFLREVGAAILNPVGSLNRLLRGELGRDFPNPEDRFPSLVVLSADFGYRHIGGGAAHPDQGTSFALPALWRSVRRGPEAPVRLLLDRHRHQLAGRRAHVAHRGARDPEGVGADRPLRPGAPHLRVLAGVRVPEQRVAGLRRANLQRRSSCRNTTSAPG